MRQDLTSFRQKWWKNVKKSTKRNGIDLKRMDKLLYTGAQTEPPGSICTKNASLTPTVFARTARLFHNRQAPKNMEFWRCGIHGTTKRKIPTALWPKQKLLYKRSWRWKSSNTWSLLSSSTRFFCMSSQTMSLNYDLEWPRHTRTP